MVTKTVIRTKKIGTHKLNKIVALAYEKDDRFIISWRVCLEKIEIGKRMIRGFGQTKTEARNNFEREFAKNLYRVKDLLK